MSVPSLTLRLDKGSPLTPAEMDGNLGILRDFCNSLETTLAEAFDEDGVLLQVVGPDQIKSTAVGNGLIKAATTDPISVNVDDSTIAFDGSTPKKLIVKDGGVGFPQCAAGVPSGSHIVVAYEVASGTDGGTFTAGSWQTRPLNTTRRNQNGALLSLASNVMRLKAGTYRCRFWAIGNQVDQHKTRLRNTTAGTTLVLGSSSYSSHSVNDCSISCGEGYFTIADDVQDLELQHQGTYTTANTGMGRPASFGENEVYAVIEFWKES